MGIGDWGVNGIDIFIGKFVVYIVVVGIWLECIIVVNLDVGIDNVYLFNDLFYFGNCYVRVCGECYDELIYEYFEVVSELYLYVLLYFEDFGVFNVCCILV